MNMICAGGYSRISKAEARRRFYSGQSTYVMASKMNPVNHWSEPLLMTNHGSDDTFEQWIDAYTYYNCDRVRGTYPAFYVRADFLYLQV